MTTTPPSTGRMLARGLAKRCPRCGATGIFHSYFKLKERCPTCGYRFQREAGAFTGALLIAWTFTLALMILPLFAYVLWRGITGNDDLAFVPFAVLSITFAVLVPLLGYPLTVSTWAAVDLASRPLDPDELADAEANATT
ncbi:MAG: putative rane protein [Actinomycetia bacterium]|nr:putative rane protein [Actinomycetes bacterium]